MRTESLNHSVLLEAVTSHMEEQDVFLKQKGAPSKVDETPVAPQATFSWYTGEPKRFSQFVRKPVFVKGTESKNS